ncbi:MAG: hypothetical protein RID18_04450, partial [Cytophagales bacterium]
LLEIPCDIFYKIGNLDLFQSIAGTNACYGFSRLAAREMVIIFILMLYGLEIIRKMFVVVGFSQPAGEEEEYKNAEK